MSNYVTGPTTYEQIRWSAAALRRDPAAMGNGVIGNLEANDPQFTAAMRDATPYLASLAASVLEFDDLRCATLDIIESAFNSVAAHGFNPDTVSRILAALNPQLFVVWNAAIRDAYFPNHPPNGATYAQFLSVMRMAALSIANDARTQHGTDNPARRLSAELGIDPPFNLAKFIDDYNWLTLERGMVYQGGAVAV